MKDAFPISEGCSDEVRAPHPRRQPLRLDFGRIQLAMEKAAKYDGIMVVHAEDDDLVQFNYEKFREEGRTEGANLHLVHNKLSEQLAFRRTIGVAAATGAAVSLACTPAPNGEQPRFAPRYPRPPPSPG